MFNIDLAVYLLKHMLVLWTTAMSDDPNGGSVGFIVMAFRYE